MCVTVGPNTFRTTRRVHRLVAEAFIPNPLNLPEVDHIDDVRTNNDVSNLQWITRQDNIKKIPPERYKGIHQHEKNGRSKLNLQSARYIRYEYNVLKIPIAKLAKKYHCGWTTISHVIKNETWKEHSSATTIESVTREKNLCE